MSQKKRKEEQLERLRIDFLSLLTKNLIHEEYNGYLLFSHSFHIYLESLKKSNPLSYDLPISIPTLLKDEWYFEEDYTKELLEELEKRNLIAYCDEKKESYFLVMNNKLLSGYLQWVKGISSGNDSYVNIWKEIFEEELEQSLKHSTWDKCEKEAKRGILTIAFSRKLTENSLLSNQAKSVYLSSFERYLEDLKDSNVLLYNPTIQIRELIDDEWYLEEDYTKELLEELERSNFITYQDPQKSTYSLNIDRNMLICYFKLRNRILSGKL